MMKKNASSNLGGVGETQTIPSHSLKRPFSQVVQEQLDDSLKTKEELLNEIKELREMNARLEIALDLVEESVSICDQENIVIYMNRASEGLLGTQLKESMLGNNFFRVLKLSNVTEKLSMPNFKEWKGRCKVKCEERIKSVDLGTFKRASPNEGSFLVNIMKTTTSPLTISSILETLRSFPLPFGLWNQENGSPSFRLVDLNSMAQTLLSPTLLTPGKTLKETLSNTSSSDSISSFFASVVESNEVRSIDHFVLDSKAYNLTVFPLPLQCVGVLFHTSVDRSITSPHVPTVPGKVIEESSDNFPHISYPLPVHLPAVGIFPIEVFQWAFHFHPHFCTIFQKRLVNSRYELFYLMSNPAATTARRQPTKHYAPGTPMSAIEPLFNDPKLLSALEKNEVGTPIHYVFHSFVNEKYKGGVYSSLMVPLPDDYVLNVSLPLSYAYVRHLESLLDQCCKTQEGQSNGVLLLSDRLDSIPQSTQDLTPSIISPPTSLPNFSIPSPSNTATSPTFTQKRNPIPEDLSALLGTPSQPINAETFRKYFDESSMGMALVSTKGEFLAVNYSWGRLLGYSPEELLLHTFASHTHPEDIQKSIGLFHQMINGEIHSFRMTKRFIHKEGHSVWCLLTTSTIVNSTGSVSFFSSSIQLVSNVQAALNTTVIMREDELYREAFIKNPLPASVITSAGIVSNVNRAFWEFLGYDGVTVAGKPFESFFLKSDQPNVRGAIQRITQRRVGAFQMLARASTIDGKLFLTLLFMTGITDVNAAVSHVGCTLLSTSTVQDTMQRLIEAEEQSIMRDTT